MEVVGILKGRKRERRTYEEGEDVAEFRKVLCVGEFGSALRVGFGVDAVDFGDYLVLDFWIED